MKTNGADRIPIQDFTTIYKRHYYDVFSKLLRKTHERATAEDLTQDVFLKVWDYYDPQRNSEAEQPQNSFNGFLNRIIRCVYIDYVRRKVNQPYEDIEDIEGRLSENLGSVSLDDLVEYKKLRALVEQLKPLKREVIVLNYFWGYSFSQIAQQTGIPEGTVKARLNAGRKELRELLR